MGAPHQYHENGYAAAEQTLGPRGLIDRTEYIRLLEQALRALGYEGVAQQLEAASGIVQQPPQAAAFRAAVLGGLYDEALRLLPSVAADAQVLDRARLLLLRQKYVEGVQRGQTAEALQVLRQELQPLHVQQQVLHGLAALLLQSPAAAAAGGGGLPPGSTASEEQLAAARPALLDELQESLMPSLLIPECRLEELVEQALLSQLDRSRYHNTWAAHLSLFTDYKAGAEQLPTEPGQTLDAHSSEVWCVAFSPDGRWAATASKDGSALLWEVTGSGRLERPRPLLRLASPCQLVSFSPDSQLVLTASMDSTVRLHEVAAARQLRQYRVTDEGGQQAVVALSWFPDSRQFLAATHKSLLVYGTEGGAPLRRLPPTHTFVYDAAVGPDGAVIITVGQDKRVALHRLSDQRTEFMPESGAVTSLSLSRCGRFLTTNLTDSCVHLWQLPPGLGGEQVERIHALGSAGSSVQCGGGVQMASNGTVLIGGSGIGVGSGSDGAWHGVGDPHACGNDPLDALPSAPLHALCMADARPSRYVLRSCVGGATSGFVACGAEDSQLYIWRRASGEQLACLAGHSGCINAVAWHPRYPWLLASASDDGTVRTWLAPGALQRQQ